MEDAVAAAEAGADAVGLVFHAPAARGISQEKARGILSALPPFVTPVALFVDAAADEILRVTEELGIGTVQLHGDEGPDVIAALAGRGRRVLKAIRCDETLAERLRQARVWAGLAGIVLESPGTSGGSGRANDWPLVVQCISEGLFAGLPPIIAAGGLTPKSVFSVVRVICPYAVDVSSGIESSKGIKSIEKMRRFVEEVREADSVARASSP